MAHQGPSQFVLFHMNMEPQATPDPPHFPSHFWRRLLARCVDIPTTFLVALILFSFWYVAAEMIAAVSNLSDFARLVLDLVMSQFVVIGAIIIHDALALNLCSTTLGKWLLGIRVTQEDGSCPTIPQGARRTNRMLRAHWYTLGMPWANWTPVWTFRRIRRTGVSTWDKAAGTNLVVQRVGALKTTIAFGIGLVALITFVTLALVSQGMVREEVRNIVLTHVEEGSGPTSKSSLVQEPARVPGWETVDIPDVCSFQIPPTMEIQDDSSMLGQLGESVRKTVGSKTPEVVIQPRNLNSQPSNESYCRIIVHTVHGSDNEFLPIHQKLRFTPLELAEIDSALRVETERAQIGSLIDFESWVPASVVRLSGIDALKHSYTRSSVGKADSPVIVQVWSVQNGNRLHRLWVAFRQSEQGRWEQDCQRIIESFYFYSQ